MTSNRRKAVAAATAGAIALSVTGFAGTAHADPADDAAIVAGNIPAAVEYLVESVQLALDNYQNNTDGYPLSNLNFELLGIAVPGTVSVLGANTEQFGQLGIATAFVTGGIAGTLFPFTANYDEDPVTVVDVIDPDTAAIVVGNVPTVVTGVQAALVDATTEGLAGNLTEDQPFFPGAGTPALVGSTLEAYYSILRIGDDVPFHSNLLGTTYFQDNAGVGLGFVGLIPVVATVDYVRDLEAQLAPVFEALAPVTEPIIEALDGLRP